MKVALTLAVQKFTNSLPSYSPLFTSETSIAELERTVAIHFLRTGQFTTAETFLQVCPLHLLISRSLFELSNKLGIWSPHSFRSKVSIC